MDIEKPQPSYISLTVSISSKGQRDAYTRMFMRRQWEQVTIEKNNFCFMQDSKS